jgi:hypothetical protein
MDEAAAATRTDGDAENIYRISCNIGVYPSSGNGVDFVAGLSYSRCGRVIGSLTVSHHAMHPLLAAAIRDRVSQCVGCVGFPCKCTTNRRQLLAIKQVLASLCRIVSDSQLRVTDKHTPEEILQILDGSATEIYEL